MYKKGLYTTDDVTTRNYRNTSPHIYIVAHVIMLYYCQRHQWNSNHLFALLCGVADRPSDCIVASLRILHSKTEHFHIVVSLKFYELLTRYYGYSVLSVSTLEVLVHNSSTFCGESIDLSFARSVNQEIWTSKLQADKTDRPTRWVAIWFIFGTLMKLWVQSSYSSL
jgi:hypothetical protein